MAHDVATCTYYTGVDLFTKEQVYIARQRKDRKLQQALMRSFNSQNDFEGCEALHQR